MPLSDEILPGLLASKVVAAREHLHDLIDGIGLIMAEIGFRNYALRQSNYLLLMGMDSGPWFAVMERIQGTISRLFALVSGLLVLHQTRFEGVAGSEEELVMRTSLAHAKSEAQRIIGFFMQVASRALTFDCVTKNCAFWEQQTNSDAEYMLFEAKVMCRFVQIFAGILRFHLEAVENIYISGQLLPQPYQP